MHNIYTVYIYIYRYRWNQSSLSVPKSSWLHWGLAFALTFRFIFFLWRHFAIMVTSTRYHKIEVFELLSIALRSSFFSSAACWRVPNLPVRPRWSSLDCQPLVFQHHPGRIEKTIQKNRQIKPGGCQLDHMDKFTFPLVNLQKAMENGQRNSGFSH